MPIIQVSALPQYLNNMSFKNAADQYKNFCTIRRDLRKADFLCTYVIDFQESVKRGGLTETLTNLLPLASAAAMHAIVLYARWFKATSGKTSIHARDYFSSSSPEIATHVRIINLRDKYVAHNELDLLGGDRVWVNTDDNGKFLRSDSDWVEQLWMQDAGADMHGFRTCIHLVHDKIDAEIIPDRQRKLDAKLKEVFG